jgi:hypothetical protein
MTIKTLKIWDVEDPYGRGSSVDKLYAFQDNLAGVYDGDLAHLIGYEGGGGVAWLNVICSSSYGFAYSGIGSWYGDVPNYSWTVDVMAHEAGHNLGAHHSHDCVWGPNRNKAIDCCGARAGYDSCAGGCNADVDFPEGGGTVMSYCHLNHKKDFVEGFHPWTAERML